MKRLKKLAKIFSFHSEYDNAGLFVTTEELLEQKKYAAYLRSMSKNLITSNQAGDVKSAFRGRGLELEEIRAYTFGDDVRDIDWRVTARKDTPFTKIYAEEKDLEIQIVLNLSANMAFGTKKELKSVSAAKIAALLTWSAIEHKDRLGCIIFDGKNNYRYKPQSHMANVVAVFKKIAEVSQNLIKKLASGGESFAKTIRLLQQNLKGQTTVFIISDFGNIDEEQQKAIAGLSKKCKVYLINVFDVLEENAPPSGEYMAEDGGKKVIFDSGSKQFRNLYYQYFAEKRDKMRDFAIKFGCSYIEVRTDIELYKQLKLA